MPALFVYLLKVNIVLILFYLAYRFILRPLTFYMLNRIFLVGGIVFSTVYPLIDISSVVNKNKEIAPELVRYIPDWQSRVLALPGRAQPVTGHMDFWIIAQGVFWVGVVLMIVRLLIQLTSLYRLHRKSRPVSWNGYLFRSVDEPVSPFSFLRHIYLNTGQLNERELGQVLKHEQVHVREWHTADVLLAELSTIFYWFNPGAWLMKNAVKENLEFITDYRIIAGGADSKAYQYSLLRIGTLEQNSPLVNHFNILTLKKRIIMMNKKRSAPIQVTKYLLMIPVVVVLALVFTVSKAQLGDLKTPSLLLTRITQPSASLAKKLAPVTNMLPLQKITSAAGLPAQRKVTSDTSKAKRVAIDSTMRYIVDGKLISGPLFNKLDPGTIRSIRIFKPQSAQRIFGPETNGAVLFVVTEANKDDEEVVKILEKIQAIEPVVFRTRQALTLVPSLADTAVRAVRINGTTVYNRAATVDIAYAPAEVRVARLKGVSVTKATVSGGAPVADTVIVSQRPIVRNVQAVTVQGYSSRRQPSGFLNPEGKMVVINGKEASDADIRNLKADDIEEVKVSRDTKKYGPKAKDGVFLVKTKK